MFAHVGRWLGRVVLSHVAGGAEVGQELALDGADFRPETVLRGYLNGFFPMPDGQGRMRWLAPPERGVIPIDGFHVPKNLARLLRQGKFEIRINTAFSVVIRGCAERDATWITPTIIAAYEELYRRELVRSVEAWQDGQLVGGLYGVSLGRYFVTESQFHRVRDAGKIAFIALGEILQAGGYLLHDVQYKTEFLDQFGCVELPAGEFRQQLLAAVLQPGRFELPASAADLDAPAQRVKAK